MPTLASLCVPGKLSTGHLVAEFNTPGIGHILKHGGCDFVFLDCEHSGFSDETVKWMVRAFQAADVAVITRARAKTYTHVARILDMGSEGIILPMLGTAEQAKDLAAWAHYPPVGVRGAGFGMAHDDYAPGPAAAKMVAADKRVKTFAQIETVEGVANVEAIAATPGIDGIWIGQFDLSASLGIPAQFDHPKFREATLAITAAGKRHGKTLGRLVMSEAEARQAWEDGFHMLAYGTDAATLQAAIAHGTAVLRRLPGA
jgi:2-keto-3-deoxy-L-rhamnonate aldolase RhmA